MGTMQQALSGDSVAAAVPVAAPSASETSRPSESATLALRVRDRDGERDTFRQVSVPLEGGQATFAQVEARVAAKFRSSRGADGVELGLRRLAALVRLTDRLEIADDEDVALLRDGDELEACFARAQPQDS